MVLSPMSHVEFKRKSCHMSLRSPCRMSILRNAHVAVSNLRNSRVAVSYLVSWTHIVNLVILTISRSAGPTVTSSVWGCHLYVSRMPENLNPYAMVSGKDMGLLSIYCIFFPKGLYPQANFVIESADYSGGIGQFYRRFFIKQVYCSHSHLLPIYQEENRRDKYRPSGYGFKSLEHQRYTSAILKSAILSQGL